MCGIAGIVGTGPLADDIAAMVASQHHRGPDDYGVWTEEAAGVALGHNRLSIIDLSSAGHQPMTDGHGLWLVFNGEIYNYLELRAELKGYPFRSQTDTEVILAAWRRWGVDCLRRFVGMFAFALWDAHERRLYCVRDRLGIKPFHYARHGGRFVFASEVKALIAVGLPVAPDRQTWADYLVHGTYDHGERTFFEGVSSLPPGHYATLQDGTWMVRPYWSLAPTEPPLALSDDEAGERLISLLTDSVKLRLRSDVPVGINLSGGLDSSLLMLVCDSVARESDSTTEAFTATFGDPNYDEQCFADQVPRRNWHRRHEVRLAPEECWGLLDSGIWHQEAPIGGVATLAYQKLHAEARRRGVIVLLEGQGADEMLAGYSYFLPAYWRDLLEARQCSALRREWRAIEPGARQRWIALTRSFVNDGAVAVHYDGTSHLTGASLAPDLITLAGAPPQFAHLFGGHLDAALTRDLRHTKLPRVLRMNDRLSMASSTELREPFLDHRVVEFACRLPSYQKIRMGLGKYVQRHALRGHLPDAVRMAPKRNVVTPQREWLRGPLRAAAESVIESRSFAERGFFDAPAARTQFRRFAEGEGDNSFFVWQWINAEMWFRTFVDRAPRDRCPPLNEVYRQ